MSTLAAPLPGLAVRFRALADQWETATRFSADPSAAASHPAYRSMIALG